MWKLLENKSQSREERKLLLGIIIVISTTTTTHTQAHTSLVCTLFNEFSRWVCERERKRESSVCLSVYSIIFLIEMRKKKKLCCFTSQTLPKEGREGERQKQAYPKENCSDEVWEKKTGKRREIENEMSCAMAANWVEISRAKTEPYSPIPTSLVLPPPPYSQCRAAVAKYTPTHTHTHKPRLTHRNSSASSSNNNSNKSREK